MSITNIRAARPAVTLDEFIQMSSDQKERAIQQSEATLRSYEDSGVKPPQSVVWGHYDLMDAFG